MDGQRGREREIVSQSAKYVAMSSLVPRSSPQFDHTKSRKCPDPILISSTKYRFCWRD